MLFALRLKDFAYGANLVTMEHEKLLRDPEEKRDVPKVDDEIVDGWNAARIYVNRKYGSKHGLELVKACRADSKKIYRLDPTFHLVELPTVEAMTRDLGHERLQQMIIKLLPNSVDENPMIENIVRALHALQASTWKHYVDAGAIT